MGRTLRMPSTEQLPPGSRRDFVDLVFLLYREAHRPSLREISKKIADLDLKGTASPETIRRMLNGTHVPARWETVEAVLLAFCDLSGRNPRGQFYYGDDPEPTTRGVQIERAWHRALDFPDEIDQPPSTVTDPWSGEPPF